jgi:hypothetical protein
VSVSRKVMILSLFNPLILTLNGEKKKEKMKNEKEVKSHFIVLIIVVLRGIFGRA